MHSLTCARKQGEETALEGWGELGARAVGRVVGRAGEEYASAQGIIAAGHSQGCAMLAAPHLCPGATKVLPSVPDKMFRRSGRQQLREEPEGVLTHALHPSLAAFGPPRRCRRAPTWLDQRAAMGPWRPRANRLRLRRESAETTALLRSTAEKIGRGRPRTGGGEWRRCTRFLMGGDWSSTPRCLLVRGVSAWTTPPRVPPPPGRLSDRSTPIAGRWSRSRRHVGSIPAGASPADNVRSSDP